MAERCYIHGPTTTAGTCPTCDAMQSDAKDAEITRLRARLAEAEAAKADAWDEAIKAVNDSLPVPLDWLWNSKVDQSAVTQKCAAAIRALVNPYRSKNDAN